jgi:hypothetical protein
VGLPFFRNMILGTVKFCGIKQTKGGHGLPKDSFRLQTMTAFNQKLLQGVQGKKKEVEKIRR